jgi:hypothetical protein
LDKGDEVFLGPLEGDIQSPVAQQLSEGALNDPTNSSRGEGPIPAAGNRLHGDTERLAGLGQPFALKAEITQRRSPELAAGEIAQHRDDALAVMHVRRRDVDRQRNAVLVDAEMEGFTV